MRKYTFAILTLLGCSSGASSVGVPLFYTIIDGTPASERLFVVSGKLHGEKNEVFDGIPFRQTCGMQLEASFPDGISFSWRGPPGVSIYNTGNSAARYETWKAKVDSLNDSKVRLEVTVESGSVDSFQGLPSWDRGITLRAIRVVPLGTTTKLELGTSLPGFKMSAEVAVQEIDRKTGKPK